MFRVTAETTKKKYYFCYADVVVEPEKEIMIIGKNFRTYFYHDPNHKGVYRKCYDITEEGQKIYEYLKVLKGDNEIIYKYKKS